MSVEAIVERIISDAEEEAKAIILSAEKRAEQTRAEAAERAEKYKNGTEAENAAKRTAILEGRAATARLDSSKIMLAEKRRVIDDIYIRALKELNALPKKDAVKFAERLISEHAEHGDEILFAENYAFAKEVAALDIVKEKGLKFSTKTIPLEGGFILVGKNSDKDISYGALLAADREAMQAETAMKIFASEINPE